MPALCTGVTREGTVISGTVRWLPDEVNRMDAFQLIEALTQMQQFALYYNKSYIQPKKELEAKRRRLRKKTKRIRTNVQIWGSLVVVSTGVWMSMALLESTRFSVLSFVLAALTLVSILIFLPQLIRFMVVNRRNSNRLHMLSQELSELEQNRTEKVFGEFRDQLLSGCVVLPDYYLSENALEDMIQSLYNHRASDIGEAVALYEQKANRVKPPKNPLDTITLRRQPEPPAAKPDLLFWDGTPNPEALRRIGFYLENLADSLSSAEE